MKKAATLLLQSLFLIPSTVFAQQPMPRMDHAVVENHTPISEMTDAQRDAMRTNSKPGAGIWTPQQQDSFNQRRRAHIQNRFQNLSPQHQQRILERNRKKDEADSQNKTDDSSDSKDTTQQQ